ncbi:tRNA modification GTPase MnmE [Buchnera aphidicola (Phyllaphis fagi)]|uniref:tRNA uridine-5-carboxymethylaminomethyl(34) synthesis GTPase MnmE n=1 Tax=Buchnera aphidicola TaxID=9 RepID=UPI003464B96A
MIFDDTIVAQSTPYGRSSVGILKISGTKSKDVAYKILGKIPIKKYVNYLSFLDSSGAIIDKGIALWFPSPHSFTGEDVLELQGHGNPVILDLLIKTITSIDHVRLANPGEFSERAFLNGKIDLIQAESIMDLIHSNSEESIKSSLRSLQGLFSKKIHTLINNILHLRVLIETIINFPEDDITISNNKINTELDIIVNDINMMNKIAYSGNILKEGVKVVIVGEPNSGKSSIFNSLLLNDTSIVTDIEGTTRDLIHECINIGGIIFQITDTAGLRTTKNTIEILGINKTWQQINLSDHILYVIDSSHANQLKLYQVFLNLSKKFPSKTRLTILFNKSDILDKKAYLKIDKKTGKSKIFISAKTGDGIEILKDHLKQEAIGLNVNNFFESVFSARRRHVNILQLIRKKIQISQINWKKLKNFELLADDLRLVQNYFNKITGSVTSDEVLDSIFSNFCIGK